MEKSGFIDVERQGARGSKRCERWIRPSDEIVAKYTTKNHDSQGQNVPLRLSDDLGKQATLNTEIEITATESTKTVVGINPKRPAGQQIRKAEPEESTKYPGSYIIRCSRHDKFVFERVELGQKEVACKACGQVYAIDWAGAGIRAPKESRDYSGHPQTYGCPKCHTLLLWDEKRHGFECQKCNTLYSWRGETR